MNTESIYKPDPQDKAELISPSTQHKIRIQTSYREKDTPPALDIKI
ncbi:MAG: hypothetical protein JXD21_00050 [Candidatus Omnitrophica bacterium]|nr:hypothetical protein [Candidatus Omnitrophota bacterium]